MSNRHFNPDKLINRLALIMIAAMMLTACTALRIRNPPPRAKEAQVQIPGMPGVRAWGDQFSEDFQRDMVESIRQEKANGLFQEGGYLDILAISGGGGDGAFGAGLINGWTTAGNRPRFKLVTGVSTGALTAPFAFLGPAYDAKLKKVYTTISSADIFKLRSLLAMLRTDSITLNDPLSKLTTEYVDDRMLEDIAAEHNKGRRLFISTTALDAQRPVIWNMGAIAASGHRDAPDLFRKIMIASAAVPVAFPPVYFKVEAGGKRYDEMHVDGGVANQVFLFGSTLDVADGVRELGKARPMRKPRVFVIRNTRVAPNWQEIAPLIRSIAPRSVSSLIAAQGIGDLFRIFVSAEQDGMDFNLAFIPDEMNTNRSDEFDTHVMTVLFDTGYKLARFGYRWYKTPPGFFRPRPDGTIPRLPERRRLGKPDSEI